MTKNKIVRSSIKHWRKILKYVETQAGWVTASSIYDAIGESIGAEGCPLCKAYKDGFGCDKCPLAKTDNHCYDPRSAYMITTRYDVGRQFVAAEFAMRIRKYMLPALKACLEKGE
jgi:hypothetical protein